MGESSRSACEIESLAKATATARIDGIRSWRGMLQMRGFGCAAWQGAGVRDWRHDSGLCRGVDLSAWMEEQPAKGCSRAARSRMASRTPAAAGAATAKLVSQLLPQPAKIARSARAHQSRSPRYRAAD